MDFRSVVVFTRCSCRSTTRETSHEIGIFQSLGGTKGLLYAVGFEDACEIDLYSGVYHQCRWIDDLWHCCWNWSRLLRFYADEPVEVIWSVKSRLTEVPISLYIPYWLLVCIFALLVILCSLASSFSLRSIVKQPIAFTAKGGRYCFV